MIYSFLIGSKEFCSTAWTLQKSATNAVVAWNSSELSGRNPISGQVSSEWGYGKCIKNQVNYYVLNHMTIYRCRRIIRCMVMKL